MNGLTYLELISNIAIKNELSFFLEIRKTRRVNLSERINISFAKKKSYLKKNPLKNGISAKNAF